MISGSRKQSFRTSRRPRLVAEPAQHQAGSRIDAEGVGQPEPGRQRRLRRHRRAHHAGRPRGPLRGDACGHDGARLLRRAQEGRRLLRRCQQQVQLQSGQEEAPPAERVPRHQPDGAGEQRRQGAQGAALRDHLLQHDGYVVLRTKLDY